MTSDNLTPWPKGVSGNPAGRKKGSRNRSTLFREWLELASTTGEGEVIDDVAKALILKALSGDVPAVKEILDSVYGKVTDKQELTGKDGGPIETKDITVRFVE